MGRVTAEVRVLVRALRHPRTPWYAKAWVLLVVAYAVSPIDLIPDPIPVLGLLDDALLVPLGVALARRLVPPDVLAECRAAPPGPPPPRAVLVAGAVLVVGCWGLLAWLGWSWLG